MLKLRKIIDGHSLYSFYLEKFSGNVFLQEIDFKHGGRYSVILYDNESLKHIISPSSERAMIISLDDKYIYINGDEGHFYKINISTLEIKDSINLWPLYNGYNSKYMICNSQNGLLLVDQLSKKIMWQQSFSSSRVFFDKNILLCRPSLSQNLDNKLFRIDVESGKILWEFTPPEKFYFNFGTGVSTISGFYKDLLITTDADFNVYLIDINTGKLQSIYNSENFPFLDGNFRNAGGVIFQEKNIPYFGNFFGRLNLLTGEILGFDLTLLLEPYWDRFQQSTYIHCMIENLILIGTHQYLSEAEVSKEAVFNLLAIDAIKKEIVWKHQFPYYGLANYKEARYENGRLYFLDQDGTLTIFEKQTQT